MSESLLVAEKATKTFFRKSRDTAQDFHAVDSVDLTLNPGELIELKGRSGSGKSTLLNMLGGLLEPDSGIVRLEGNDLYSFGDGELSKLRNSRIGVIPQGHTALHNLTIVQNVTLPYQMYRDDDAETRALGLLAELGIEHLADSYPSELSGGEIRRMAIARALVCAPKIVLADEPTGDLDDENTGIVLGKLRDVANEGAAVLLVTHEQEAERFADRVLRMDAGKLVE